MVVISIGGSCGGGAIGCVIGFGRGVGIGVVIGIVTVAIALIFSPNTVRIVLEVPLQHILWQ